MNNSKLPQAKPRSMVPLKARDGSGAEGGRGAATTKIVLAGKYSLPAGFISGQTPAVSAGKGAEDEEDEEEEEEGSVMSQSVALGRKKGETPEERKQRKHEVGVGVVLHMSVFL